MLVLVDDLTLRNSDPGVCCCCCSSWLSWWFSCCCCCISFDVFQFCKNCLLISWISLPSSNSKLGANTMIRSRYLFLRQIGFPVSSSFVNADQHLSNKFISFMSSSWLFVAIKWSKFLSGPISLNVSKRLSDMFNSLKLFCVERRRKRWNKINQFEKIRQMKWNETYDESEKSSGLEYELFAVGQHLIFDVKFG